MSNHAHPAPDQLAAFASGQAAEDSAVQISQHLADCEACRTLIDKLPEDTLVSLLRQSSASDGPTNGHAGVKEALTAGISSQAIGIPRELADHPRYHVLGLLGTGGMGAVYKAEHRRMERLVALKVINAGLINRPDMVERFHREARAAARLTHPNIVTAHDADQAGDIHFLVMEFVEGNSLAQRVQEQGPLPVADACNYIRQAALGLEHAAEQGMVHRDIKPHNLMLTPRGQVKILDFGLARFARETAGPAVQEQSDIAPAKSGLTEVGVLMGTADFIAPEQASDPRKADVRADIYSLGCTLYYLLAGHSPFPEGTVVDKLIAHAERSPKPLAKIRSDIPLVLARVVDKLMAKNPKDRYQTPAEVAESLTPFMNKYRPRKRPLARLAVAAGLLAAAVVIYVQTDRGEFEIWTNDDQVALLINKNGVTVHDPVSKREYELKVGKSSLPSGEYLVSEPSGGIEFSTRKFTITRGGKERLVATLRFGGLRDEAMRWFPASATFFGGRDLSVFKELSLQQIIVLTQMAENLNLQDPDRFWKLMGIVGNIDRLSFAYVQDQKEPARSRIFIRLTGKLSHARLAEFFRKDWPMAKVSEKKGPKGELITIADSSGPVTPAWAIIGDTDLVAAGYQGVTGKHVEVVEQLLELRAGKGENLATAKTKLLSELPPGTWAFFAGRPPEALGNLFLFPVLPRSLQLTISGTKDIKVHFQGNFASAGDARRFTDNIGTLKEQGLGFLKRLPFDDKTADQLANMLKALKADVKGDAVNIAYELPGEAGEAVPRMLQKLPLALFDKLAPFFPKGKGTGKETMMLKKFGPVDKTISQDLAADQGGWRIDAKEPRTVRLFELAKPAVEDGIITYRAKMKSEKLQGKAYLEMWCRLPGLGESFSKGLQNPIQGSTGWASYEIPFFLKKGQTPDLLKLNFNIEGKGTVWIKDVEVHFLRAASRIWSEDQERQSKFDGGTKAAEAWLKLVDQGKYAESWEQSSKANREGITKQDMVKIYQDLFGKLGKLVSRDLSHPFTPDGERVVVYFKTVYKNLKVIETVTTVLEKDGQWRVGGYQYEAQSSEAVIEAALRAADAWLKLKDQEKYDQCWEQSSALSKKSVSKEDVVKLQKELLKKMGKVESRIRVSRQFESSLPGAPAGEYVFIEYQAKYSILKDTIETVIPMLDKDGVWRVSGYHYAPGKHEFAEFADKQAPGKERRMKAFGPRDKPLTQADQVVAEEGGWRIDVKSPKETAVRLFEVSDPGVDNCMVFYRLKIKTRLLKYDFAGKKGEAYQEMWCRFPGIKGEAFSKGLNKKVSGNTEWTEVAIPFRLEKRHRPDLIRLNLVVSGRGQVWIKDVEVVRAPLEK